jgi:enamine deaminase RidA (YjgF/YER057c/UK114 family)
MSLETRLEELGIVLPAPPRPLGAYVPAVVTGPLLFLSGMLPIKDGRPAMTGRMGVDLTIEQGRHAARLAALNGLAVARESLGSLDRIHRAVRLVTHIRCAPDFADLAAVADGASELLALLFGSGGGHARLAVGAVSLPALVPVELELVFEID